MILQKAVILSEMTSSPGKSRDFEKYVIFEKNRDFKKFVILKKIRNFEKYVIFEKSCNFKKFVICLHDICIKGG